MKIRDECEEEDKECNADINGVVDDEIIVEINDGINSKNDGGVNAENYVEHNIEIGDEINA